MNTNAQSSPMQMQYGYADTQNSPGRDNSAYDPGRYASGSPGASPSHASASAPGT